MIIFKAEQEIHQKSSRIFNIIKTEKDLAHLVCADDQENLMNDGVSNNSLWLIVSRLQKDNEVFPVLHNI